MSPSALSVSRVSFGYGEGSANILEDISLQLRAGEVVCLIGPSGCGKTTLLNLIAGLVMPRTGNIEHRVAANGTHSLGYIFQNDALLPWRTIRANIELAVELKKKPTTDVMDRKIREKLDAFELEPSILGKYPRELSGGMRQRIALIQCLMLDPGVLLLDEPFASVDFFTRLKLESDLRQMVAGQDRAALLVTHDIDEAIAVGDRIVVMGKCPQGISSEIGVDFAGRERQSPEQMRGHERFGRIFSHVWRELRHVS